MAQIAPTATPFEGWNRCLFMGLFSGCASGISYRGTDGAQRTNLAFRAAAAGRLCDVIRDYHRMCRRSPLRPASPVVGFCRRGWVCFRVDQRKNRVIADDVVSSPVLRRGSTYVAIRATCATGCGTGAGRRTVSRHGGGSERSLIRSSMRGRFRQSGRSPRHRLSRWCETKRTRSGSA